MLTRVFRELSTAGLSCLCLGVVTVACQPQKAMDNGATVKTTDVRHSRIKWQSIGNCWLYAALGWGESLAMYNGKEVDFSESYLTYRHIENQLLAGDVVSEVTTGGFWYEAVELIRSYGLLKEGDFIPGESTATYSKTQKTAVDFINASLKSGKLKTDRSDATVRSELDAAFGVKLVTLKDKIIYADAVQVARKRGDKPPKTLAEELDSWTEQTWNNPDLWNIQKSDLPLGPLKLSEANVALLKRVKRALNARKPVVMSWYVDFNAMNDQGIFSIETLKKAGKPGRQGGHMTVLEDYVAHGVDPATGKEFKTTEGKNTPELQKLAEKYGEIDYFVVKNSWGGAERPDRASYTHDGTKGFTRLEASYLFGAMVTVDEKTLKPDGVSLGINEFILPKGY